MSASAPRDPLQYELFGETARTGAQPGSQRRFVHRLGAFDYELRRSARKSIGIRIDDTMVRVSAPRWVSIGQVEQVLADKADWVRKQLQLRESRLREQAVQRIDWGDGARLPWLGGTLLLRLGQPVARPRLSECGGSLLLALPPGCAPELLREHTERWMRAQARRHLGGVAEEFARRLGVHLRSVALSSARTRWGSASADGRLRLHWRLMHLPPPIVDYVVAHEVAHLREMNHGPRFWATVAQLYPDWQRARDTLRRSVLPRW